jgi:hypothetical protein
MKSIRITIPPPTDHGYCDDCPFLEGDFDTSCNIDCEKNFLFGNARPGPDCPGPGEYALVPVAQWEEVQDAK